MVLRRRLTRLDSYRLSLLTYPEVIAVDQAAHPARPVSTATGQRVWRIQNADGSYTLALYNLGSSPAAVAAQFSDLGITGSATIRDLWNRKGLGSYHGSFNARLPAHGSRLLKVTPTGGPC